MREAIQRVIILGLDGATFELLDPWIEAGLLPHLAEAKQRGVWGYLQSTVPPYTAAAWSTLITGKNPGKHGVVDFWHYSHLGSQKRPIDASWIKSSTLWEILNQHHLKAGIVNVPVSYPPQAIDGFMISGMLTPNEKVDYTYPVSLKYELIDQLGEYAANPFVAVTQSAESLHKILYWIQQQEKANQYLLRNYPTEFFFNVVQAPDTIQHHFWNHLTPSHPAFSSEAADRYQNMLLKCYQAVDQVVGSRLSMVDERTVLFIISDHGFGPAHKWFNVNRFLADLGLLYFKRDQRGFTGQILEWIGLEWSNVLDWMRRLDVFKLRGRLSNLKRAQFREWLSEQFSGTIDWERTKAYYPSVTGEAIYVNLKGREPNGIVAPGIEYEQVREKIIKELHELVDPETHQPIVENVFRREDLYAGDWVEQLPDIILSFGARPYLPVAMAGMKGLTEPMPLSSGGGRHRPNGILIAVGPQIAKDKQIDGARLCDIAPTVLYTLGLPVPEDMDGVVLRSAFNANVLKRQPVLYSKPTITERGQTILSDSYSHADEQQILENLRNLGYTE